LTTAEVQLRRSSSNPVAQLLRVSLFPNRPLAAACAVFTVLAALAVSAVRPPVYHGGAELVVLEPTIVHRLANPFAAVPNQSQAAAGLGEELMSRDHLVAYVKGTGLVDQWASSRPLPLKLKDRLMEAVRGPLPEKDVLDALVGAVEKKLHVTVEGNHVRIAVEWPTPEGAFGLASAAVTAIREHRETHEVEALEMTATSLEEQLAALRAEMKASVDAMQLEWSRAMTEGRRADLDRLEQQFVRDQTRSAELLVRSEEKRISAEVMRRTNVLRFVVLTRPVLPPHPVEAEPYVRVLFLALAALLAGLAGALTLAFASRTILWGRQLEHAVRLPVLAALRAPSQRPGRLLRQPGLLIAAALACATGAAWAFFPTAPVLALVPPIAAGAAWAVWKLPLKWPLAGLMLLAVTLDDPGDRAYVHEWHSPFYAAGHFFFTNVAWFTGFELSLVGLAVLMVVRRIITVDPREAVDPRAPGAPRPMRFSLLLSAGSIAWLVVLGLVHGGVFREALWQFRGLLTIPLAATLAIYAFDFPKDLKLLVRVLAIGSVVKTALGMYFVYVICKPRGIDPANTTGHNDSMIFVISASIALLMLWERPRWQHLFIGLLWLAVVFEAMVLNDRRIAYVDLAFVAAVVFIVSPRHRAKRFLMRAAVVMLPLVLVYGAVGWNSRGSAVFKPVLKVRSIIAPVENTEEESSNVERDIENFNLLRSWQRNMFLGQGFGSAFDQVLPSNDFGQSNFGHLGHNSVLWLMWIGGALGFTGVLLYIGVAAYALGRTLRVTRAWQERVALFAALAIFITYLMQAFGDMGMLSVQFDFFLAAAIAIIGRFTVKKGTMLSVAPSRV
jgi:hypothetical protein